MNWKNFWEGFGSILDIWPNTDYTKHVPTQQTREERMKARAKSVGDRLRKATDKINKQINEKGKNNGH